MSPGVAFLIVRMVLALLMFAFLGVVGWLLWRDVRLAAQYSENRGRPVGQFIDTSQNVAYPLLLLTTIGRSPTNTISVHDETVSLQHARVSRRDGQWWLEDLGSRNGTLLNGDSFSGAVVISPGDMIGIGAVTFRFDAAPESQV
ncbi:MAG: FHA domain-containing protein [Anaerolineales bacterium]